MSARVLVLLAILAAPLWAQKEVPTDPGAFRPDPTYADKPYDPEKQVAIYGGKHPNPTARPLLELGRPLYAYGPFQPAPTILGEKNPLFWHFMVYGDWRTAVASNDNGAKEVSTVASRLNLDIDMKLTATERIHAFVSPLERQGEFTRVDFGGDDHGFEERFDGEPDALFFEGDAARIVEGISGKDNSLDLPFSAGFMPMLLQNGVWMEDNVTGFAFTLPSMHSAALDISNLDVTFFAFFDEVESGAIRNEKGLVEKDEASLYGATAFLEAAGGYWEVGYGYTDGQGEFDKFDYHNLTVAYTRRYGGWLSNSIRVIGCFGQDLSDRERTANGAIVLLENSLITSEPLAFVPYLNLFAGFDRPQSLARAGGAGGILKNTGMLYETDGLTGFPKLDDTGNDTVGGAIGVEYLFGLDHQIVVEAGGFHAFGEDVRRPAKGDQFGFEARYQLPLSNRWILRADAMIGFREDEEDLSGVRLEFRLKF